MKKHAVQNKFDVNGFYTSIRFSWDETFEFYGESHDFWEIVFVASGQVEVTEDEKIYTLEKNNMILHAPMEFHRIKSKGGSTPQGLIMSFDVEGDLPETLKNGVFELNNDLRAAYSDLFDKIYDYIKGKTINPYASQEAAALLSAFLIRLADNQTNKKTDQSTQAILYQKIVSSMLESVCDNLTLEDFSRKNNVSVSYIKLLFKKYAGISPKAYYTGLKLRYATELLKSGLSITEVADRMSFSSPNYFSLFYKKNVGTLPSELKRK